MTIIVSGEQKEVRDELTIAKLIELEKVEMPLYVSVAVNDDFAKREEFETYKLQEGDVVEFLYFMGGGQ